METNKPRKTRMIIAAAIVIAIVVVFSFMRSPEPEPPIPAPQPEPELQSLPDLASAPPVSPWKKTTVSYDAPCEAECVEAMEPFVQAQGVHSGEINLYYRPDIDDEIAQWGDCLQSIMTCIDGHGLVNAAEAFRPCVADSACPELCKDVFENQAVQKQQSLDELLSLLEKVFINDGAVCLPQETGAGQ